MTIQEAFEELKRRCPGRYVEVTYRINNFEGQKPTNATHAYYGAYQDGPGTKFGKGKTWKAALDDLTGPDPIEPCDDGESLLDHERQEEARMEAAVIRREMKEGGKA